MKLTGNAGEGGGACRYEEDGQSRIARSTAMFCHNLLARPRPWMAGWQPSSVLTRWTDSVYDELFV